MIYLVCIITASLFFISLDVFFARRDFVQKMDEIRSAIWEVADAITEEKIVQIPDDIVELLKRISKKTPAAILDDYRPIYEAGLGDGAAELAKEILERLED